MNKYFQMMWIAVAILAAWLIRAWPRPVIAAILIASALSPALIAVWHVRSNVVTVTAAQERAARWIAANTPERAVFVTDAFINSPIDLAGRLRISTFGPYVSNLGYDPAPREADIKAIYCDGPEVAVERMASYGATYVLSSGGVPCDPGVRRRTSTRAPVRDGLRRSKASPCGACWTTSRDGRDRSGALDPAPRDWFAVAPPRTGRVCPDRCRAYDLDAAIHRSSSRMSCPASSRPGRSPRRATTSDRTVLPFLTTGLELKQPMYFAATVPFQAVFGNGVVAVRAPAVLFGVLTTLLLVWLLLVLHTGRRVALIGGALFADQPVGDPLRPGGVGARGLPAVRGGRHRSVVGGPARPSSAMRRSGRRSSSPSAPTPTIRRS